jgi:hypothetical protein
LLKEEFPEGSVGNFLDKVGNFLGSESDLLVFVSVMVQRKTKIV